MARRRFRSNQRHEPVTERSFQEYVLSSSAQQTSRTELVRLIRGGEDTFLELKVKLSNSERIAQAIVALANTGGGVIVFGVSDQMRVEGVDDAESVQQELVRICREDMNPPIVPFIDRIAFDSGRRVVAIEIEGKQRPYRTRDGRVFIRVGEEKREASVEELDALLERAWPFHYESLEAPRASVEDIDEALVWSFIREIETERFVEAGASGYPTSQVLERDLMLAINRDGETIPTIAGVLLFGTDARVAEVFPGSAITATRFGGDNVQAPIVERVQLAGNLHTLFESGLRFIKRYCDLYDSKQRSSRPELSNEPAVVPRASYHTASISEGLANALVHRDLGLRDVSTRLHIFDRSIEIINPRRTAAFPPSAQRAIRFGIPQRLNPQIAAIFTNPAYGLDLPAGGLPVLLRETGRFSGRRAEIYIFNDQFRLRIHGS